MEDSPQSHEQPPERSPEAVMVLGDVLLDDFRQADSKLREARIAEKRNHTPTPVNDALEAWHDQLLTILAKLPSHDVELARYIYKKLTSSDDPHDRLQAATFFSRMLPVDKQMGLAMLTRLIGREETEHAVMDRAWDELTTTVTSDNLLTLSEAAEYIGIYHAQLKDHWRTQT
jgi:hypothetical protein